jgi:hypothetical protein
MSRLATSFIMLALAATVTMSAPARAQLRGSTDSVPPFTAADRIVIERNEMLRSIADTHPALVRRALNALAALDDVQPRGALMPTEPQPAPRSPGNSTPASRNPDLDRLERSSPEAMNDLFQLLKQAGARRPRPSR